jgi:hypothetical protein
MENNRIYFPKYNVDIVITRYNKWKDKLVGGYDKYNKQY